MERAHEGFASSFRAAKSLTAVKYKLIALDFDGVIVESVLIKDRAFQDLFGRFPAHLDEIMAYHRSHHAVIRFEKFRHIFNHILKKPYTDDIEKELADRFHKDIIHQMLACPFVKGAEAFLEFFSQQVPLYLISISPADELNDILKQRKLNAYFKEVYAVPWKKKDALLDIQRKEQVSSGEIIFIGDSPEDQKAASEAGVDFLARQSQNQMPNETSPLFDDLEAAHSWLLKRMSAYESAH
ncbi:MAG: hypothetical protein COV74_09790 [Candidatus Omnitrophica bacterium CG11_big_fil_rev_8_21_14_0_20_45_26]|uniref:phosphoglycolate phosphatase n=1 Tax=Candidatus Abzuiibacterium crystallinum TaxID=1974748 RepID=A0A2H0LLH1_9BACT|nr:MAG: hypothetical protein COV74_09790 [Candidatus Omnitrophica bacterium CG11_big_fil_rev_8_21_14_0_20_45_26]PIW64498.1 MAG: hypothetical protein COW12_05915 [Candidatus Omnitrophica bacterium CG12_big_fil_rev_8_21_14_0_65_45_16]